MFHNFYKKNNKSCQKKKKNLNCVNLRTRMNEKKMLEDWNDYVKFRKWVLHFSQIICSV